MYGWHITPIEAEPYTGELPLTVNVHPVAQYAGRGPHRTLPDCQTCPVARQCMASVRAHGPMLRDCERAAERDTRVSGRPAHVLHWLRDHPGATFYDMISGTGFSRTAVKNAITELLRTELIWSQKHGQKISRHNGGTWLARYYPVEEDT